MGLEGLAELPLHEGHVPAWMAQYMKRLLKAIISIIVEEYGPAEVVRRLSDPIWFQALNNAIGMDWDSSGSTTVTTALLRQVADENPELGLVVVGGKGALARRVPEDLERKASERGLPSRLVEEAVLASRLAAKTDSSLLQDGYTLYHHVLVVAETGEWCIVQQGMNVEAKLARRYHWLSPLKPSEPTVKPHSGIAYSRLASDVVDLTSPVSREARSTILDLVRQDPRKTFREIAEAYRIAKGIPAITLWTVGAQGERVQVVKYYRPQLRPPTKQVERVLKAVYEVNPRTFEDFVLVKGVGPSLLLSLALVSELIYGAEVSHADPANVPMDPFKYAYVVGGKDGVPHPFDAKRAEEVIKFLEEAIERAKLGSREKLAALRRLRALLAGRAR